MDTISVHKPIVGFAFLPKRALWNPKGGKKQQKRVVAVVYCFGLAWFKYMVGYQSVDILEELRGITRNDKELLEVQSGIKM
jgi:hypothetical protein